MLKKKIKLITVGTLIILAIISSGCGLVKYNNIGHFKADESMALYKEKKYDEAIKSVDSFLEKYPNNKQAISQKAYILIGSGKNEDGLIMLTNMYEDGVRDSAALDNMSWAYNNLHMYEMAGKYIDLCLKTFPGDEEEYVNKGNALFGLKKYDDAITYYDKALKMNPKYTLALYGKALSLYSSGDYSNCLDYFKKYVEAGGDNKSINNYILNAYLKQNDINGAIDEFNSQINKNPDKFSLYIMLGSIYEKKDDFDKAIDSYDTVINKKNDYAEAYYDKAICLVKLGKKDEACNNLKFAIKYDEEYVYDIEDDPKFDSIRNYDKFQALINKED